MSTILIIVLIIGLVMVGGLLGVAATSWISVASNADDAMERMFNNDKENPNAD